MREVRSPTSMQNRSYSFQAVQGGQPKEFYAENLPDLPNVPLWVTNEKKTDRTSGLVSSVDNEKGTGSNFDAEEKL